MDSAEYCRQFKIDPDDIRCSDPFQIVESHTKVTIPVRSAPRLTSWQTPGNWDGIVAVRAGDGKAISASKFTKWLAGKEGGLVAVATTDGEVTTLTRIDNY
jgi:hypothetical protein